MQIKRSLTLVGIISFGVPLVIIILKEGMGRYYIYSNICNAEAQDLHADSAYVGKEQEKTISKYKLNNKVHEKGYRNAPLTDEKKTAIKKNQKQEQELNTYLDLWNKA